ADSTGELPDSAILADDSLGPALGGTGYDCFRRIGAFRMNSAGYPFGFRIMGRQLYYQRAHTVFSGFPFGGVPGSPSAIVDASMYVPPISQRAILRADVDITSPSGFVDELRFYDGGLPDYSVAVVAALMRELDTIANLRFLYSNQDFKIQVGTSQEFRMVSSGANVTGATVQVRGFDMDPIP
ncbi:MAG TPA: hypothetical protein VMZ50_09510, partial [Phycisphaerae bacterium]|nr:hypothetical protein [Phycisphaerae bacterium]